MKLFLKMLMLTFIPLISVLCFQAQATEPQVKQSIACQEPRPEMCTMDYKPVCATKDNGVRCITTPCDSTDFVTYSNACSACSDAKVYAYQAGACPE